MTLPTGPSPGAFVVRNKWDAPLVLEECLRAWKALPWYVRLYRRTSYKLRTLMDWFLL